MDRLHKGKWDESHARYENAIFYPKEEVVKFLNRFVRKKLSAKEFRDFMDFSVKVRGLDCGCGAGRMTALLEEFGMEAYGIDISERAIEMARENAVSLGMPELAGRLNVYDGESIPFEDGYFDVTLCESVLDSMHFEIARKIMDEIGRVTRRFAFISLISGDDGLHGADFDGEEIVDTLHEQGTVQSYFNWDKVNLLVSGTSLNIKWARQITEQSLTDDFRYSRYYIVLEK